MLTRMAENNAWANFRFHRAVGALSDDAYKATRTSFFPSIHLTLTHILFVDLYYVDALEGGTVGKKIWPKAELFEREGTFATLRTMQAEVDKRLIECSRGDPADSIRMERESHVQVDTRENVLLHLFQHQIHHRGQAHAMLSGTDIKPPQLDEFFMSAELPLRRDELTALGLPIR